jgi:hypothetical protein
MENTEMWNKCPRDNEKNSKIQNLVRYLPLEQVFCYYHGFLHV